MYNGLEKQKQLKLRKIFQAIAVKTNDLADEYSEIFPLKDDPYVKCLENPENCDEVFESLEDIEETKNISAHPVHILDSNGQTNPSALIPFCLVGDKLIGEIADGFSQPVCNIFTPKMFEGQLCYSVNLNKIEPRPEFGNGPDKGLTLLVDLNEERSVESAFTLTTKGMQAKYTKFQNEILYI